MGETPRDKANDIFEGEEPRPTPRQEGRNIACEGIVRSRFGERPTCAGARALERLAGELGRRGRFVRPKLIVFAASGFAAAAAVTMFVALQPTPAPAEDPTAPRLASVIGVPLVSRPGGRELPAVPGCALEPGTELRTGKADTAVLSYADGSSIRLAGAGRITILRAGMAKRLFVHSGELFAEIAPQPEGAPMTFETPHGLAIVRGTRLALRVTELALRLEVLEGAVELSAAGEKLLVTSSQVASIGRGSPPAFGELYSDEPASTGTGKEAPSPTKPRHMRERPVLHGKIVQVDAASGRLAVLLEGGNVRTFTLHRHTTVVLRGPVLDEVRTGDMATLRLSPEGEPFMLIIARPGVSPPPERRERIEAPGGHPDMHEGPEL